MVNLQKLLQQIVDNTQAKPTDPAIIDLLNKIVNNTGDHHSLYVAVIAGSAGVLGAALTSVFAYFISKSNLRLEEKKIRATVITAERLRWLQELRLKYSLFYVSLDFQFNLLKRPTNGLVNAEFQQQLDDYSKSAMDSAHQIFTLLNPEKDGQKELFESVNLALKFILECFRLRSQGRMEFDDAQYQIIKQDAYNGLIKIGSKTWAKIEQLE